MNTYQKYLGHFEHGFMGGCTLGILVQSCLGAVAAMSVLQHGTSLVQMVQLFLVVASCMLFNGSVLSQQKPKITFNLLLSGLVINTIISIINFAS